MTDRKWTSDIPATPGAYWHRKRAGAETLVLNVVEMYSEAARLVVWFGSVCEDVADLRGEWCGPLVVPE